jgi:outer membrane protein OmpA-like peptidoglycan-associated protein
MAWPRVSHADDCRRIRNIVILFDASGFMKERDYWKRFLNQMNLFRRAVPVTADGFFNVALRHYGYKVGMGCQSTESVFGLSRWDPDRFLNSFPPHVSYGTSALCAGLRGAAEDLAGVSGKSAILVIGGGLESCDENPIKITEQIIFNNPDLEIHTFQIGNLQDGRFYLGNIAKKGKGTYQRLRPTRSPSQWYAWMKRHLVQRCPQAATPAPRAQPAEPALGVIKFDNNSFSVRSKDPVTDARNQAAAAQVAQYLLRNPKRRLVLHGYSSGRGAKKHNYELSRKRAEAVAHHLNRAYGIPLDRMSSVAHGEAQSSGGTKKAPRRVEFEILSPTR